MFISTDRGDESGSQGEPDFSNLENGLYLIITMRAKHMKRMVFSIFFLISLCVNVQANDLEYIYDDGRKIFFKFVDELEKQREPKGIPLTYEIIFLSAFSDKTVK